MAGFNFDSIKNGLNKFTDSFRQPADNGARDDQYAENEYEDQYEGDYQNNYEENYEEEDLYSEDGYEDDYASDSYSEDGYDESSYDEVNYDEPYDEEDDYASSNYYAQDTEDGYQEGEYEEEYDPAYTSGEAYDEYDDDEDLGYNPAVFENLDSENESYDDQYDDGEYDDENGVYGYEGEYYEEEAYQDEEEQPSAVGAVANTALDFILTNDIAMYVALVILPPLGIWLLWRKNKFDITVRSAISVASLIWMIIMLILLFSRGGDDDVTSNPPADFMNHTATPAVTATVKPTAPLTQPTQPATTPNTGIQNPGVANPQNTASAPTSYVFVDNNGLHYHNLENCGGMTGASKITLDTATSRGKTACPVCVGGGITTNPNGSALPTGTQYYATPGGTWYHVNSSCQGMTGASVVTEANAIAAGKTACPECIGYYGTPGGKYYHSISNCSKMQNAITNTEAEWIKTGKTACTVCITSDKKVGSTVSKDSTQVYATENGTYYHTIKDCSGMKDASLISIQSAVSAKKAKCPRCVSPSRVTVFGTSGGKYYHTKSNCSGMKNAISVTAEYAIKNGKEACPTCASMFSSASSSNLSSTTTGSTGTGFNTADTAVYVYATEGGTYMHLKSNCSGMANAKKVTFQQAVNAKKKVCPDCITPAKLNVYATDGGKWFHTVSNCQGMKNAVTLTAKKAMDFGKTACPECAKALSTSATTSNNNANAGSNNNNNTTGSFTGNNTNTNTSFTTDNGSSKPTTGSASSTVYILAGKAYYHVGARCSAQGVSGANAVTLEYAIERDYKACPSCNPPSRISY